MAKKLDKNLPVALGNCIHVMNLEAGSPGHANEDPVLVCIQVEDKTGQREYPILLTQMEYESLRRVQPVDMDDRKFGRCYNQFIEDTNYFVIKLRDASGSVSCGLFEIGFFGKCYERAITHPKSVTRKNFIRDLMD